jgi:hypothetical protein
MLCLPGSPNNASKTLKTSRPSLKPALAYTRTIRTLTTQLCPSAASQRRAMQELDAMTASQLMTAEQAATLKQLAKAAYELDAFKPNLTHAEADQRIAILTAKLKLLDAPPHTL